VDIGYANGRLFLVSCGVGLDAEVAHRFNSMTKRRGILPYVWHAFAAYFSYRPREISADVDGIKIKITAMITSVLNGPQYGGGAVIAPLATVYDGMMDLCWVKKVNPLKAAISLPALFNGTLDKHTDIYSSVRGRNIKLECGSPHWFHLDGEDFFSDSGIVEVKTVHAGINVICPPPKDGVRGTEPRRR